MAGRQDHPSSDVVLCWSSLVCAASEQRLIHDGWLLSRVLASAVGTPCTGVNETDRAFLQRQLSKGLRCRKPRTEFGHATSASKRSEQRRFLAFIRCPLQSHCLQAVTPH